MLNSPPEYDRLNFDLDILPLSSIHSLASPSRNLVNCLVLITVITKVTNRNGNGSDSLLLWI